MLTVKTAVARPFRQFQGDLTSHVLITLMAQSGATLPVNLALLLDTSGSMEGEKLTAVKEVARLVCRQLRPQDTIALITFDGEVRVVVPAGLVGANRDRLLQEIEQLTAGGVTLLRPALAAARSELAKNQAGRASFAVMLSDGYPTDDDGNIDSNYQPYFDEAGRFAGSSAALLTAGIGDAANYDRSFLQELAEKGNGQSGYSKEPAGMETYFREALAIIQNAAIADSEIVFQNLNGTIQRVAKVFPDVQMLAEAVAVNTSLKLGPLPAGQAQAYIVELIVPGSAAAGTDSTRNLCRFNVRYQTGSGWEQISDGVDITYTANQTVVEKEDRNIMEMVRRLDLAFYGSIMEKSVIANDPRKTMRAAQQVANLADELKMTQQRDFARTVYQNAVTGNLHKTTRHDVANQNQTMRKTVSLSNLISDPRKTR